MSVESPSVVLTRDISIFLINNHYACKDFEQNYKVYRTIVV